MRGLETGCQAQDKEVKLEMSCEKLNNARTELRSLLEHHFILFASTRVVLGPLDGEERRFEEFLVRVLLAGILLYKVVFQELLADPLVTSFQMFRNEPRVIHKCCILGVRKRKRVTWSAIGGNADKIHMRSLPSHHQASSSRCTSRLPRQGSVCISKSGSLTG